MRRFLPALLFLLAACQTLPTVSFPNALKVSLNQPKTAIITRMGVPFKTLPLSKGEYWGSYRIPESGFSLAEYRLIWGGGILTTHRSMHPIPPRTCRLIFLFDNEGISRSVAFRNCPERVSEPAPYPPLPSTLHVKKEPEIPPFIPEVNLPRN